MLILVVNPGSTSTKMAVYEDEMPLVMRSISHSNEDLAHFDDVIEQLDYRKQLVLDELQRVNLPLEFDAVIGRGGLVKPIAGGVYEINQKMLDDTYSGIAMHNHACNLGCLIAHDIACCIPRCRAFIADPGVVDELNDYARISGSPLMNRICIWHALNQRAIARRFAQEIGKRYEDLNLIICHLGGGISVAAHDHGRAVDANNALDGEGPFSPERAGSLPAADLIRLCFSGKYSEKQLLKRIAGKAAVFCGKVDAILLTGGLARSEYVISRLRQRIDFLAPTYCFPGEDEMEALALNALAVLRGQRTVMEYD